MNDPENFLTRWSRRKRKAEESVPPAVAERDQNKAEARPEERAADATPPKPAPAPNVETTEPVFDLSKLPPIESITAETDIRGFLAPGVPADVRLAALRRAWAADPKVRDFVGLNDYDFDFHTPGAIHGFGPLEMTDALRQEVVRIVSGWQPPAPDAPTVPAETSRASEAAVPPAQPVAAAPEPSKHQDSAGTTAEETAGSAPGHPATAQDELMGDKETTQRSTQYAASQQKHSQPENLQTLARRGHGRALPK